MSSPLKKNFEKICFSNKINYLALKKFRLPGGQALLNRGSDPDQARIRPGLSQDQTPQYRPNPPSLLNLNPDWETKTTRLKPEPD
jgi:hypothetical protein